MSGLWLRKWPAPWARVVLIASATFTVSLALPLAVPISVSLPGTAWTQSGLGGTIWAAPALQTEPPAPSAALTPEALANAEYFLGQDVPETLGEEVAGELPEEAGESEAGVQVQLTDGYFVDATRRIQLLPEWTVYGDFTGDGADDAAVILEISAPESDAPADDPGQAGSRYDLAIVIDQEGTPLNLVTLSLGHPLSIQSVEMDEGEIGVNLIESTPEESTGELPVTFLFVLEGDQVLQYEIPGLTPVLLTNATYPNVTVAEAIDEDEITLIDGDFEDEEAGIGVSLSGDFAFGDLNGDRVPDAAVVLVGTGGGTGVFVDLAAVLNLDGEPMPVDTVFLGDRMRIEDLWIDRGRIVLDVITHGPEDPMCCPTQAARLGFALENDTLIEVEIEAEADAEAEQPAPRIAAAYGPLLPALDGDGYGYVNLAGEMIIEPQFQSAYPFAEGLAAAAVDGNEFGYIDATGAFVIEPQFAFAGDFHQGIAVVGFGSEPEPESEPETNQSAGQAYINRQGELLFEGATFVAANDFHEGLAAVRTDNGQYGYIDRRGELAIEARFDTAQRFSGGLALVSIDGQYGFINRRGTFAIAAQFTQGGTFAEGLAPVEIFDQFGYINMLGDLLIRPQFEVAGDFREGAALVTVEGQELYIDPAGNVLNPELEMTNGGDFHEGRAAITVDGLVGYIDSAGEVVIEPQFLGGGNFENGLAVVRTPDTWGVIDTMGEWVLQLAAR